MNTLGTPGKAAGAMVRGADQVLNNSSGTEGDNSNQTTEVISKDEPN